MGFTAFGRSVLTEPVVPAFLRNPVGQGNKGLGSPFTRAIGYVFGIRDLPNAQRGVAPRDSAFQAALPNAGSFPQLSGAAWFMYEAGERVRTVNIQLGRLMLCQLSYARKSTQIFC